MGRKSFRISQPRWFGSNRLYKVYVEDSGLYGARIGGQLSDPRAADIILQVIVLVSFAAVFTELLDRGLAGLKPAFIILTPVLALYYLLKRWFKGKVESREKTEEKYDTMDPQSKGFLTGDMSNFVIGADEIKQVKIKTNSFWANMWHGASSHLEVELRDGSARRFAIIDELSPEELKDNLSMVARSITVE